jgi:NTE family protein
MIRAFGIHFIRLPLLLPVALLIPPQGLHAQSPAQARPKIGLALEGGGALGLAHISVLDWFEQHHIPVDFIGGTSMGGLVGGLYATGMRPSRIRDLVLGMDWGEAIGGQTPFQALTYRRKQDKRAFQNNLEFGLKNGFSLPGGLNSGQNVSFLLDRETLAYSNVASFDDLPVPFRCVGTDLVDGKARVFKDGPLGEALRATMSLPAVFGPVKSDGKVYADGGLMDNLPVDVVKQMGADIVIAVHLQVGPYNAAGGQTIFSVMNRSIGVMIDANVLRSLERADLVVTVDLNGFSSAAYDSAEKIMARGTDAANQKLSVLSRLAVDEAAWRQYQDRLDSRRIRSVPVPSFVEVVSPDHRVSQQVERALAHDVGKPIDTKQLEQDINVVSGGGRYSSLSYHLGESAGKPGLIVEPNEKEHGPPFLNVGFLIDGGDLDNVKFTSNARITAMDIGGFGSEWRTDVSLGATWGLTSEYYRPFSRSKWFVAPRIGATSNQFTIYRHSDRLADYRIRQAGGALDLGYAIDRFSELRVGYEAAYLQSSLQIGEPVLPTFSGRLGVASIRYDLDRLDSPIVPRRGGAVTFRTQWNDASPGAAHGFPLSELFAAVVRPVSKRASVYVQGSGGTTFGHDQTGVQQFFLGGPGHLGAYGANEIRTDQYWLARVGYLHELFRMPLLLGDKVYFTSSYELAKAYGAPGVSRLPNDAAVGFVSETFVGPVFIGGSWGDSGHRKIYFTLGRFF